MTIRRASMGLFLALGPALCAILLLGASPMAYSQSADEEETDQQFLSRTQSRLKRSERRIENIERTVRQKMGTPTNPTDGYGTSGSLGTSGGFGQPNRDSMSGDLRRMQLDLRTMKKKIDKDIDRMAEDYREREDEAFDRDYWESYALRLERKLDEMERDLRRL